MTFDEALLDDEDAIAARDGGRLLWSLATAGAQVRRAGEGAAEFGIERLRSDTAPRALLVATDLPGADALLTRCSSAATASVAWRGADLPRWAGAADALLIASVDGHSPRLATLAAQGAQRGLEMAVVAPDSTAVAGAVGGRAPWHELPRELHPRAARWAVLTPLFQALDALGVTQVPPSLVVEIADALDEQAERCRPSGETFTNAAKSLAVELAESVPLIVGAGPLAAIAAETIAVSLGLSAGVAASAVSLPDGMAQAAAVLRSAESSGESSDDFFRDRVDDASSRPRPRLVVIGDDGEPDDPLLGEQPAASLQLDEVAARRGAATLRDLATSVGVRSSSVDVPAGQALARFAAATAFGDFTAAYLGLGLGTVAR